jgi:hypothetical protein
MGACRKGAVGNSNPFKTPRGRSRTNSEKSHKSCGSASLVASTCLFDKNEEPTFAGHSSGE